MSSRYREPLFDLLSYARRGPGRRDRVASTDLPHIARTVSRTPEVMVKVLSRGANEVSAVRKHLEYISRKGKVDLETDGDDKLQDAKDMLDDWDLELEEYRAGSDLSATNRKQQPRLVHKVLFSMPAGTPPTKVLAAVQNLCREEFALKHRYAMALHTDEPHPHVHVVIKAMSEQSVRLHIRKATLRQWRADFAKHLRVLGVPANATQRYVRGETTPRKSDGIYRASLRGQSTHMRERADIVARELMRGELHEEPARKVLVARRRDAERAWSAVSDSLAHQGQNELAAQVRRFMSEMPPPTTEKEYVARQLLQLTKSRDLSERPPVR